MWSHATDERQRRSGKTYVVESRTEDREESGAEAVTRQARAEPMTEGGERETRQKGEEQSREESRDQSSDQSREKPAEFRAMNVEMRDPELAGEELPRSKGRG